MRTAERNELRDVQQNAIVIDVRYSWLLVPVCRKKINICAFPVCTWPTRRARTKRVLAHHSLLLTLLLNNSLLCKSSTVLGERTNGGTAKVGAGRGEPRFGGPCVVGWGGVEGGWRHESCLPFWCSTGLQLHGCRLRKARIRWWKGEEVCSLHALFGITDSCRTITPFAPEMLWALGGVFPFAQRTSAKDGPFPWDQHSHAPLYTHTQTRSGRPSLRRLH